jgi:hypothetical protein
MTMTEQRTVAAPRNDSCVEHVDVLVVVRTTCST